MWGGERQMLLSGVSCSLASAGPGAGAAVRKVKTMQLTPEDYLECALDVQARNEELARRAAKVSEDDMAAAQAEFEARCATAERKVRSASASTRHQPCGIDLHGSQLSHVCCCDDGGQLAGHAAGLAALREEPSCLWLGAGVCPDQGA